MIDTPRDPRILNHELYAQIAKEFRIKETAFQDKLARRRQELEDGTRTMEAIEAILRKEIPREHYSQASIDLNYWLRYLGSLIGQAIVRINLFVLPPLLFFVIAYWLTPEFTTLFLALVAICGVIMRRNLARSARRLWEDAKRHAHQLDKEEHITHPWKGITRQSVLLWADAFYSSQRQTQIPSSTHRFIVLMFDFLATLYVIPPLLLEKTIIQRNPKRHPNIPLDIIPLAWDIALAAVAYFTATHSKYFSPQLFAGWMIFTSFYLSCRLLLPRFGGTNYYETAAISMGSSISIGRVLKYGLFIIVGFGILHYCTSRQTPSSYTRSLDILDSLYFSVVTATTVGYGDLSPASPKAKLICMLEMLVGFVFNAIVLASMLSLWQRNILSTGMGDENQTQTDERHQDGQSPGL